MYFLILNVNAYNFKSMFYCLINGDGMHFYTMYHHLSKICDVGTKFVKHDGEEWCLDIIILGKVSKECNFDFTLVCKIVPSPNPSLLENSKTYSKLIILVIK
jgi:hypothetical protein